MFKTYRSQKTFVKESPIEGKGLFALENIEKDEIIAIRGGYITTFDEVVRLNKEIGDYSLKISDELFLGVKTKDEIEDYAVFINHSCEPNVGMSGRLAFVAMRAIYAGEELCIDYAMIIDYQYRLDCKCDIKHCRGIITGEDWKSEELQNRYKGYFSSFIYNKINNTVESDLLANANHLPD